MDATRLLSIYLINVSVSTKIVFDHNGTAPFTDVVMSTIGIRNATLNILCVYRSPRSTRDQDAKLYEILQDFTSKKRESLILGDFNAPAIDWHARSCSAIGSFFDHLLEFAETDSYFKALPFRRDSGLALPPRS